MVTIYPKGVTIYKPEKSYNGYTGFSFPTQEKPGGLLIDMNGRTVNKWEADSSHIKGPVPRIRLLKNGHIIVLRGSIMAKGTGVQEYAWDGGLVWEYSPPLRYFSFQNDVFRKTNGNTLLICREEVPEEHRKRTNNLRRRGVLYSDVILEVTVDKKIVWEWHEYEHIDINRCNSIIFLSDRWAGSDNNTITDWIHTNTVRTLPENKWYDRGDERFKPDNVMLSLRQLDLVLIVDRDTKKIVWNYTGDYKGGLSGQHDSHMIEKGFPGESNILIFDNGASPYKDLGHAGCSFVLEIDPISKKVVWKYENEERFHSNFESSVQRLPNGNTLINEAAGGRIFEITAEGEIVWEYVIKGYSGRAYRYSYDYCPQTEALGKPKEIPVIPPQDMRISPTDHLW